MGSGDLNAKKSWHVVNLKNQQKVWESERAALAERKKVAERVEELRKERQEEEIARQLEEAGGRKRVDRVDWMYQGPSAENGGMVTEEAEAFLLGKRRIDALIKGDDHKKLEKKASHDRFAAPGGEGAGAAAGGMTAASTARDMLAKIRDDPLLAIKRQEQEAYEAMVNDPIRRRQLLASMGLSATADDKKKSSRSSSDRKRRRHDGDGDGDEDDRHRHHHHHRSHHHRHRDDEPRRHRRRDDSRDGSDSRHRRRSRSPARRRDRSGSRGRDYDRPSRRDERDGREQDGRGDRREGRNERGGRIEWSGRNQQSGKNEPNDRREQNDRRDGGQPSYRSSSDNTNGTDERARKLAAMQAAASELDQQREHRLAQREAQEAAARAADDNARARDERLGGGQSSFATSLRQQVGAMGLAERLGRGRKGLQRDEE